MNNSEYRGHDDLGLFLGRMST